METKLQKARGELIAELQGLLHSKGCHDIQQDTYEIPTYQPNKNICIFQGKDTQFAIMARSVLLEDRDAYGRKRSEGLVRKIEVETFETVYHAEELYADDLQNLVNFIKEMDDDDFFRARREYDAYVG